MSDEAQALWEEMYSELSNVEESIVGTLLARGESHVLRLAMIYAILDKKIIIETDHLEAAYAFWKYCEDTVRFIFQQNTEHRNTRTPEQKITNFLLTQESKTANRNTISKVVFNKNKSSDEIESLKNDLINNNVISIKNTQGGELWILN